MNDTASPDKRKPKRAARRLHAPVTVAKFVTSANLSGFTRRISHKKKLQSVTQSEPQQAKAAHQLPPEQTGAALIAVMRAKPHRDIELEIPRGPMPVRSIEL